MTIFTCAPTFEAMMTCIYAAWDSRLGHANVKLQLEPVTELELFADYRHIEEDSLKAEKVIRSIRRKVSPYAFQCVYAAAHSFVAERLDVIYRFLIYGFHFGPKVMEMWGVKEVAALLSLSRKVQNETHSFREFTRFSIIPAQGYFAVIAPKCDILTLLAPHFVDRMPSEAFLIADEHRLLAAVHPAEEDYYLTFLTPAEFSQMQQAAQTKDPYISLWKSFFQATAIQKRQNPACQRTLLPLWYRTHMTEFLP